MKKKRIVKYKNIIFLTFLIVCFLVLTISIYNIIKWKIDSNKTDDQIIKIKDKVIIEEVIDDIDTKIIEQVEVVPKFSPYWDYIKMNIINVDFTDLKKTNNQTKGWLQVNGTNINYPFVQAKDNKYYLTRSFDKSHNNAGWVFSDYRNKLDGTDKNTIIYAHGRNDNIMFGSLKNILKSGWLDNSNNFVVKLSTEYENTLWQVFSVYSIPTTSDYIQTEFARDNDYREFLNMLLKRSSYNFNTSVYESDNILTLSTCYNEKEKVVLHAKLIKKSN